MIKSLFFSILLSVSLFATDIYSKPKVTFIESSLTRLNSGQYSKYCIDGYLFLAYQSFNGSVTQFFVADETTGLAKPVKCDNSILEKESK